MPYKSKKQRKMAKKWKNKDARKRKEKSYA